jgi:hypothetical protein
MPFDNPEIVIELVRQDVEQVLTADPEDPRSALLPAEGFREGTAGLLSDTVGVVQWSYSGETDGRFLSAGVSAVQDENLVTIHGVTIVTEDEVGEPGFERYIDWADTFAQLGLTLTWRRAVADAIVGGQ